LPTLRKRANFIPLFYEDMRKDIHINYEHFKNSTELSEIEEVLFEKAKSAREKAYAPYSDFFVGCAILLENGDIFSGSNQENAAYPSGLCAERTTLYWVAANFPNEKIKKIFIVGGPKEFSESNPPIPPCGSCRQSIIEYETKQNENIELYFANLNEETIKVHSIKDLLPFSFDGTYL